MTTGSLGLRTSGSYGSLPQQQSQNGSSPPIQTTPPPRKPSKMLKDKDRLFHCIRKLAPRKKVGMLLLCLVSTAVFGCVLYVGKGEDSQAANIHISLNDSLPFPELPPMDGEEDEDESIFPAVNYEGIIESIAESPPSRPPPHPADEDISERMGEPPPSPPTPHPEDEGDDILPALDHEGLSESTAQLSPPPPAAPPPPTITPVSHPKYFTGYTLPPGNPCDGFTFPPPPADKKKTGPRPCPVCYLPVKQAISLMPKAPSFSPVLKNLTYIYQKSSVKTEFGGSEFGGYPSLQERSDSYDIKESMSVHCGFVRGVRPGHQTGFDIDDSDLLDMDRCRGVVVSSAIFGAYDLIQQPSNISAHAKKHVCFFMFVDEETEAFLKKSGELNSSKRIGLWRIVVIYNLPFADPRRNGKVPKLLSHRLFPNAHYALWIDGKLKLVVDPYQILERFLWRQNASFAISRHYKRFDAFVEAEANKAAGKYDNASIDFQINFYKNEGLTPYSEAKLPITSDVPEGCVIVREHIPISNLFGCLWFNEVDRFTSRDQISFSIVRDRIRSKTNWTINMFLDCQRRNFVVQGYHRDVLEHWGPPPPPGTIANPHPPPPIVGARANMTSHGISTKSAVDIPVKKIPGKKKKSSSKRNRKIAASDKDTITG